MLKPRDHPIGTKRICVDIDYFETYNRPNVTLVNLRETPIEAIEPHAVRTSEATYEVDAIVFATGFDAMTGTLLAIDPKGVGGRPLKDAWAEGPKAYLGLAVDGLPQHVPDHRAGQPQRALQHDQLDRAARGVDPRLRGLHARQRPDPHRSASRRRRKPGWRTCAGSPTRRSSRGRRPGTWAPTFPASHGCSCPTSAPATARNAPTSPPPATTASRSAKETVDVHAPG